MKNVNLISGSILKGLIKLAMPIVATSFMQMSYNLIDIFWVGRLGSVAVAAVGTGGFFTWLAFSPILLYSVGTQVGVAQSYGKKDFDLMKKYVQSSFQLALFLGSLYSLILVFFHTNLVSFFKFKSAELIQMTNSYIEVIGFGIIFLFIIESYYSIFNGYGNSKLTFLALGIGSLSNIILDPIFISVLGFGVRGAAIATILAQFIALLIFVFSMKKNRELFEGINVFEKTDKPIIKDMLKVGIYASLQSFMFTAIAMVISRIVAAFGPIAVAVQRIGVQIESVTWRTANGFNTATSTFVAQNYGAGKNERIKSGYKKSILIASIIGMLTGTVFIFFGREIYSVFIREKETIVLGGEYARILGFSQVFMSIEIVSAGAFNGLKLTKIPSVVSVVFNLLRIPGALILSAASIMGLSGIWWSISVSSIFKGLVLSLMFVYYMKKSNLLNS